MVDLMFRDESNHVIKKASKPRSRARKLKARHTPFVVPPTPTSPALRPGASQPDDGSSPSVDSLEGTSGRLPSPLLSVLNTASASSDDALGDGRIAAARPGHSQHKGFSPGDADALLRVSLPFSLQERGTAYFFSRYVATDNGCYQNYEFIYDVWKPSSSDAGLPDCVTASIAAVGLAGLSKVTRCSETMTSAQQSYGVALQLANAALKDPVQAVADKTMLAVLILGTYEFISGRTPQTLRAWKEHVNGAAALASMRGQAQFRSSAGTKMFIMLCHSVLISCIQSDIPMPRPLLDLRQELGRMTDTRSPAWRLIDPLCRALQIRHDIKMGIITDLEDIIDQLHDVEEDFNVLVDSLSRGWRFRRVQLTRSHPGVKGRWCHIYPGLTQATTWNAMRTMRMLVQETVLQQLGFGEDDPSSLPLHYQMHIAKALKLMDMLRDAVIESTPQHFGIVSSRDVVSNGYAVCSSAAPARRQPSYVPPRQSRMPHGANTSARSPASIAARGVTLLDPAEPRTDKDCDAERFLTLATASNTIIWPLYTLGMSSTCSPETKDYVMGRLEAIHRETGLEQARVVAGMVRAESARPVYRQKELLALLPCIPPASLPATV